MAKRSKQDKFPICDVKSKLYYAYSTAKQTIVNKICKDKWDQQIMDFSQKDRKSYYYHICF